MALADYSASDTGGELRWLPIDQIVPALDNPRQALTDLNDLAASIRAVGLLTPVIVEDIGDGTYRLVVGHRRHAAARIAELTELPALVRSFDPFARKTASLVENGQRVNLTPLEPSGIASDATFDILGDRVAGRLTIVQPGRVGPPRGSITEVLDLRVALDATLSG